MQKTKGKVVKAIDEMVAPRYREACRDASGLDFDNLKDDTEVLVKQNMNAYINKLQSLVGDIGVRILGRKVWQNLLKDGQAMEIVREYSPELEEGIKVIEVMLDNSGDTNETDHGKVKILKSEDNKILANSNTALNDFYVMGVIESIIVGYGYWPTKSERTKSRPEFDHSEFYFEWS